MGGGETEKSLMTKGTVLGSRAYSQFQIFKIEKNFEIEKGEPPGSKPWFQFGTDTRRRPNQYVVSKKCFFTTEHLM